jgi:hypothetical protein
MERNSNIQCPKKYSDHSNLKTTQGINCKHLEVLQRLIWYCGIPGWDYQHFAWTHDCIKFEKGNVCLDCEVRYKCITNESQLI